MHSDAGTEVTKKPTKNKKYFEDLALQYVDKEIPVTPVTDKATYINGWQNMQPEDVFTKKWPQSTNGIGLVCGEVSGIIVLDIDILDPEDEVRKHLESLPPVFSGRIGNPKKPVARFYRYNYESTERFDAIKVEILSDKTQAVLPESWHPDAMQEYTWVGRSLLEIDLDELPELPADVILYLRSKEAEYQAKGLGSRNKSGKGTLGSLDTRLHPAKGRCKHNSFNYLSTMAVFLCKDGHDFDFVLEKIKREDERVNKDSDYFFFNCRTRKEFRRTPNDREGNAEKFIKNIFDKHAPNSLGIRDVLNPQQFNVFKSKLVSGFTKTVIRKKSEVIVRQYMSLYRFYRALHLGEYIPERKSFAIWNGKYFIYKSDDFIRSFAQTYFKNPEVTSIGERSTFLELVKNKAQASIEDYSLKYTGKVNLDNGIYDINTGSLIPHDRDYRFTYKINASYIEGATCPTWDELLNNITMGRKHFQTAIEEYVGYILSGSNYDRFNKVMVLDGGGSNGKSTLIRIIENIVGPANCSAVDLVSIGKERFAAFGLVDKLLNTCSEEPREAFNDSGYLKKITGGDPIMVEEKNKGAFSAKIIAKFIISYNEMPYFPDGSDGMKRRMMIIKCDMNYEANPELKIVDVENKVMLEKSGVIIRCLNAFKQVQARGHFTEIPESNERLEEMLERSNPVLSFFKENIILSDDPDAFISNARLYERFMEHQGGFSKLKYQAFLYRISDIINKENQVKFDNKIGIKKIRTRDFGRGISGIKFLPQI